MDHSSVANHSRPESNAKSRSKIHFTDQASQRNLNHICKIAQPAHGESGLWIYQSGAGGAAAFDFDLDGWPDVYLSTIDGTPKKEDSGPNRLYRNLAGKFIEVTNASATGDKGFSQGLAVGDFNRDGFGDLYVGNIGRNHLFQNNGDGTFTDVTTKVGLSGDDWTTSVAMVDIDQDGYLDQFDVGYCAGREAFEIPCLVNGRYTACLPKEFAAQKDRVWKGRADGQFTDVTENWLGDHDPAHGLGIIAGRLDDVSGIDVYVANDMSANHFWSSSRQPGADFRLLDQATMRGVAVDYKSLSQASMVIAAGDPDLDGDIDFFLTSCSRGTAISASMSHASDSAWATLKKHV